MSVLHPIDEDPRYRVSTATGGQTAFTVPFYFQANDDIAVLFYEGGAGTGVELTEGIHYALTGAGDNAGGTATLGTPAEEGDVIVRIGRAVLERITDITVNGRFRSKAIDDEFDRFIIIALELARDLSRAYKAPYGYAGGTIGPGTSGHAPLFDELGNLVDGPSGDQIASAESFALQALAAAALAQAGAGAPIFSTKAIAEAYAPAVAPDFIQTAGYFTVGDLGGALYKKVGAEPSHDGKLSATLSDGVTVVWYELAEPLVSPQMFGALGNGAQTLFSTSYAADDANQPTTITQQTADGLAINKAIVFLRSKGAGQLHIPAGTYRTWGYLERIDFPLLLTGDGAGVSIIKNCDTSPTNANGYGCVVVHPTALSDVSIQNLTLDGNADTRAMPTGEYRSFPLVVYGDVRLSLHGVNLLNSPIDCLATNFTNSYDCSLQATNCIFDKSFRNTVSLVKGWNQHYTNCQLLHGGKVHGGTNPKYCLDIEPTAAANTIRNITFTNCILRDAENVLAGGIWAGNVEFAGCSFIVTVQGASGSGYPWTGYWRGGEFTFTGCSYTNTVDYNGQFQCANPVSTGDFVGTEFVSLRACRFLGVGLEGYGANMLLDSVDFVSSLRPVSLKGNGTQSAIVRNVTLRNVYDKNNNNGGAWSAFTILSTFEGALEIDGLRIISEPATIPAAMVLTGLTQQRGIHLAPTLAGTVSAKVSSVQVTGYYQKFPNHISGTLNASNFRDWNSPNTAPSDTAGQTTTPGALYYRNCTMYGNSA